MLARSHGAIDHDLPGMDAVSVETWIACARYGFRDRLGPPGSGHGVGPGAVADDKLASRFPAVALRVDVVLSACVPEEHPLSLLRSAAFAESGGTRGTRPLDGIHVYILPARPRVLCATGHDIQLNESVRIARVAIVFGKHAEHVGTELATVAVHPVVQRSRMNRAFRGDAPE